eukprot:UN04084
MTQQQVLSYQQGGMNQGGMNNFNNMGSPPYGQQQYTNNQGYYQQNQMQHHYQQPYEYTEDGMPHDIPEVPNNAIPDMATRAYLNPSNNNHYRESTFVEQTNFWQLKNN